MSAPTLVATDLDRTLIYSAGAAAAYGTHGRDLVAVERYRDADASFMTARAATSLAAVCAGADADVGPGAVLVPTTTRTVEQWRRITLPGPPPRWVVAANGGVLLADDAVDDAWTRSVQHRLRAVASLAEVHGHAERVCHPDWTLNLRTAEGLFCYAVLERTALPDGFVTETTAWARAHGWRVSLQGRKLYWVPAPLTKSAAVAEVADRTGADTVLAAGDSLLDADLLEAATAGVVARHGELVASGWSASHVTVTAAEGVLAGEQIVDWFAERLSAASRRSPDRPAPPRPARTARG